MVRRSPVALLVLMSLAPEPGHSDYKELYEQGQAALRQENWARARQLLEQAVDEEPSPGRYRGPGMRYQDYLPHFYLGVALLHLDECEAALGEWEIAEQQGAVKRLRDEYRKLPGYRATCEDRLLATALQAVLQRVEEADRAKSDLDELRRLLGSDWEQAEGLGPEDRRAAQLLDEARAGLEAGRAKGDRAALKEAEAMALEARWSFVAVLNRGNRRVTEAETAKDELAATGPPPPAAVSEPAAGSSAPPELALDRAQTPNPPPSPPSTAAGTPGPPELLRGAARAYFQGDYEGALEHLEGWAGLQGAPKERRAEVQARLFEAAASFALYLLGGRQDDGLRTRAVAARGECYRLAPNLTPTAGVFSPSIVRFLEDRR